MSMWQCCNGYVVEVQYTKGCLCLRVYADWLKSNAEVVVSDCLCQCGSAGMAM